MLAESFDLKKSCIFATFYQYKLKGLFGFDSKVNGYCKHAEPRDMSRKSGSQTNKWRKYLRSCCLIES